MHSLKTGDVVLVDLAWAGQTVEKSVRLHKAGAFLRSDPAHGLTQSIAVSREITGPRLTTGFALLEVGDAISRPLEPSRRRDLATQEP